MAHEGTTENWEEIQRTWEDQEERRATHYLIMGDIYFTSLSQAGHIFRDYPTVKSGRVCV